MPESPTKKRILFLDLEETIIPEWGDWIVPDGYKQKLLTFIKNFKPNRTEIFSWAIYGEEDLATFEIYRDYLAVEIQTPFEHVNDIASLIDDYRATTGIHILDERDFFDFVKKERFLFDMALKGKYPDSHLVLLDDAVESFSLELPQFNSKIEVINFKTDLQ